MLMNHDRFQVYLGDFQLVVFFISSAIALPRLTSTKECKTLKLTRNMVDPLLLV